MPRGRSTMCTACEARKIRRRGFLAMAGLGLAASAFPLRAGRALAAAGEARTSVTADEALGKLKAGNARYVTSPEVCAADLQKRRDEVAESQAPWATIVGCSDSRAPPELLFGGLG